MSDDEPVDGVVWMSDDELERRIRENPLRWQADARLAAPRRPSTEQLETILGGRRGGKVTTMHLQLELQRARRWLTVAKCVMAVQALLLVLDAGLHLVGVL